jgi:RecG-like helicase
MVQIQREYAAGQCNISKEEEALRMAAGWIGAGLTVVAALAFVALHVPAAWRLTLFLPAVMAASGFLQAGMHFCANYGMRGVFNVKNEVGKTQDVEQTEFASKDRAKAFQILGLSVLIGVIVALAGFFLP